MSRINKTDDTRYMLVWPDGEYCYDEQAESGIENCMGYPKSDDYEKVELRHGMNHVDINGMILVVELDHWGNVWERDIFSSEKP